MAFKQNEESKLEHEDVVTIEVVPAEYDIEYDEDYDIAFQLENTN